MLGDRDLDAVIAVASVVPYTSVKDAAAQKIVLGRCLDMGLGDRHGSRLNNCLHEPVDGLSSISGA